MTRIVTWSKNQQKNFKISCPSLVETQGFDGFSNVEFVYKQNQLAVYMLEKSNNQAVILLKLIVRKILRSGAKWLQKLEVSGSS